MDRILIQAYVDSIVAAIGHNSDLSYPSVGIGEERHTDHLNLLEWDVKFYWTDDVVNAPNPLNVVVQTTIRMGLGPDTTFRLGLGAWHYLTASAIQSIADDLVLDAQFTI